MAKRLKSPALLFLAGLVVVVGAGLGITRLYGVPNQPRITNTIWNASDGGVAIDGYDTVAYAKDGAPAKGTDIHAIEWQGARWQFANAENRNAFAEDPERFAPQFGGHCAMGIADGELNAADPETWTIVEGKLYLNYDNSTRAHFRANLEENIARARARWPEVAALAADETH